MRVVTREITIPTITTPVTITPIGDTHVGAIDCHEKLLKACVEKIAEREHHYWIGMGDYGEFILPGDKRFDYRMLKGNERGDKLHDFMGSQLKQTVAPFIPIKEKCLGCLEGNHETTISKQYFHDVQQRICDELESAAAYDPIAKVRNCNLTYSSIMRLVFRVGGDNSTSREVFIWLHHGAGGGRKSGSKVNRIEEQATFYPDCDLFFMGHVHSRIFSIVPAMLVKPRTNNIEERVKFFGITGTFKKTYQQDYSGYGERAQYPPTALGCISVTIVPEYGRSRIMRFEGHSASDGLPA